MLINNFDDVYIGILLYQCNQPMHDSIEKKVIKLVQKEQYVCLVDLLFFTKQINKQLFKKWSFQVIMDALKAIVLYIDSCATVFIGDEKRVYKYLKN